MTILSEFVANEQCVPPNDIMLLRHSNSVVVGLAKIGGNLTAFTAVQPSNTRWDFQWGDNRVRLVVVIARNFSLDRDEVWNIFRVGDVHESGTIHGLATKAHVDFDLARNFSDKPARRFDLTSVASSSVGCQVTGWAGREISSTARVRNRIFRELTIDLLTATTGEFVRDIEGLQSDHTLDITTRDALILARIGQGAFRTRVFDAWGGKCAATGSCVSEIIRASHIKPWRDSDNRERLNPDNGLPLVATLDALFDAGLITFDDAGTVLFSEAFAVTQRDQLGVPTALSAPPSRGQSAFLRYHHQNCFRKIAK